MNGLQSAFTQLNRHYDKISFKNVSKNIAITDMSSKQTFKTVLHSRKLGNSALKIAFSTFCAHISSLFV